MFSMQDLGWRGQKSLCRSWGFFDHFSVDYFSTAEPGVALLGTCGNLTSARLGGDDSRGRKNKKKTKTGVVVSEVEKVPLLKNFPHEDQKAQSS